MLIGAVMAGCGSQPRTWPARTEPVTVATATPAGYVETTDEPPSRATIPGLERGTASFYSGHLAGRRTANGERYDPNKMTAAHRTLPFGTWVEVRKAVDGRRVVVRINDRGPYAKDRIIDLSHKAAARLGILREGWAEVEIRTLAETAQASERPR